jgi:steroid 5-alpha reductase family enzyme
MSFGGFLFALVCVALGMSLGMSGAWLAWKRTGNSGWIDVGWTVTIGLVGLAACIFPATGAEALASRRLLAAACVAVWALRLAVHIAQRTSGIEDDPRYRKLILGWGDDASRQMFILAQKQALLSIPLVLAIALAAANPAPELRLQDWLGALVMIVAIGGEALADRQLRSFSRQPEKRGKVCDVGLWSWSRHPNYFFEWSGWFAYALLAIDAGGWVYGWVALAAPACMYWLLVAISGIPPLEEHMLKTRGDAYRDYQARTSAFFPLPPTKRQRPT